MLENTSIMINPEQFRRPQLRGTVVTQAKQATNLTRSSEFLSASHAHQQEGFEQVCRSIKNVLYQQSGGSQTYSIMSHRYYAVPDTSNYLNADHEIDQHDIDYDELRSVDGSIIDVLYVEMMMDCMKEFRDLRDYGVGDGAPCLVIRNGIDDTTYFVPMLSVDNVLYAGGMV